MLLRQGQLWNRDQKSKIFDWRNLCPSSRKCQKSGKIRWDTLVKNQSRRLAQIQWITMELIDKKAPGVETILLQLMKNIQGKWRAYMDEKRISYTLLGGDLSHNNMSLAERMLSLLTIKHSWVMNHHGVISTALFTFLRCMIDHGKFIEIQANEIKLCVKLLHERVSVVVFCSLKWTRTDCG